MATRRRVYISLARIHRLLGQLGDEPIEFTELHHAVHIRGPWVLPITAEGFEHFDPENSPSGDMDTEVAALERAVLTAMGAPRGRRVGGVGRRLIATNDLSPSSGPPEHARPPSP